MLKPTIAIAALYVTTLAVAAQAHQLPESACGAYRTQRLAVAELHNHSSHDAVILCSIDSYGQQTCSGPILHGWGNVRETCSHGPIVAIQAYRSIQGFRGPLLATQYLPAKKPGPSVDGHERTLEASKVYGQKVHQRFKLHKALLGSPQEGFTFSGGHWDNARQSLAVKRNATTW
jgi:hypothetical protein